MQQLIKEYCTYVVSTKQVREQLPVDPTKKSRGENEKTYPNDTHKHMIKKIPSSESKENPNLNSHLKNPVSHLNTSQNIL